MAKLTEEELARLAKKIKHLEYDHEVAKWMSKNRWAKELKKFRNKRLRKKLRDELKKKYW